MYLIRHLKLNLKTDAIIDNKVYPNAVFHLEKLYQPIQFSF